VITLGSEQSLWFTENQNNAIGKITESGKLIEFLIPTPNARPHAIVAGVKSDLWFTEWGATGLVPYGLH
jgi:virginiamycin B lyase